MELIFERRPRSNVNHDAYITFRRATSAAVLYEHPHIKFVNPTNVQELVENYLVDRFDSDYYVQREQEEYDLVEAAQQRFLILLSGDRGTGKTTLLRRWARNPALFGCRPNDSDGNWTRSAQLDRARETLYLDFSQPLMPDFGPKPTHHHILRTIVSQLLDLILSGPLVNDENWSSFQALHAESFHSFRTLVRQQERPRNDEDWNEITRNPTYYDDWKAAFDAFKSDEYVTNSLYVLLAFHRKTFGHDLTILVDNVDHLSHDEMSALGLALSKLMRGSWVDTRICLAVRSENSAEINDAVKGTEVKEISLQAGYDESSRVDFLVRFVKSRLQVLSDIRPAIEQMMRDEYGAEAAEDLDEMIEFNFWLIDTIVNHTFVSRSGSTSPERSFLHYLQQWYNGSLKEIAMAVERMLYDAISDSNDVLPYADLKQIRTAMPSLANQPSLALYNEQLENWRATYRPHLRTHLYRKFFFCRRLKEDKIEDRPLDLRVPRCFVLTKHRSRPPFALRFRKIHILELLIGRSDDEQRLDVNLIHEVLGETFGLREAQIRRALEDLSAPRYPEDTGLVLIEGDPTAPKSRVFVQDAGRFFIETYSRTADYLFWASRQDQDFSQVFTRALSWVTGIPVDDEQVIIPFHQVASQVFRTAVAVEFTASEILERFKREVPLRYPGDVDYERAVKHADDYAASFGKPSYAERVAAHLTGFIANLWQFGHLTYQQRVDLQERLKPVLVHGREVQRMLDDFR